MTNWYIPEMGYQENHLPHEQAKAGHMVDIITSDRFPSFPGFEGNVGLMHRGERKVKAGVEVDRGVTVHRLPCLFEIVDGGQVVLRGVRRKLKELRPDVVHAHNTLWPVSMQALLAQRRFGYKLFIDDHTNNANFFPDRWQKRAYVASSKLLYRLFNRRVSAYLSVTPASLSFLRSFTPPHSRILVTHLGADRARFSPSTEQRTRFRERWKIPPEAFVVTTAGKLDPSKRVDHLIKSFADSARSHPQMRLVVAGGGSREYLDSLLADARSLGVEPQVIFTGFIPNVELGSVYNGADVGVWPGGPSVAVLEAGATGLPLCLPGTEPAYEILFEAGAAIGYDPVASAALGDLVELLFRDDKMRNEMREKSRVLFEEKLGWDAIARELLQVYRDVE